MPSMRDFYAHPAQPLDQAHGLRRLFSPSRVRFVAVAANPHVAFAGVLLERLAAACAATGAHVLVVDAADEAPRAHELALVDLASCVQPLAEQMSYLAAGGLPLRHVDTRGSCAGLLDALADAAPQADVVIVHAGASVLGRLFMRRALRPLLLAADHPESVTHAYAAMKLLSTRTGLMAFDLLLAAAAHSVRRERIAAQLAQCADRFLGAVLHDWAAVDPVDAFDDHPGADLMRLARAALAADESARPAAATDPTDLVWTPGRRPAAPALAAN